MTKAEILTHVLARVTGKPEADVKDLFDNICAANPKIAKGFMVEVPEEQAQKDLEAMLAEGPGILLRQFFSGITSAMKISKLRHSLRFCISFSCGFFVDVCR